MACRKSSDVRTARAKSVTGHAAEFACSTWIVSGLMDQPKTHQFDRRVDKWVTVARCRDEELREI
jgi:hypothetical protein